MLCKGVARSFALSFLVLLANYPSIASAQARIWYVDGACPSDGDGTSKTCGEHGPLRSISAALERACQADAGKCNPTAAPITIRIRGAQPGFSGVYRESLALWGVGGVRTEAGSRAFALNCTATAPCVLEGCPADDCGNDETAIVSGFQRATDWQAAGSGVWARAMEARREPTSEFGLQDEHDPGFLVQEMPGGERRFLQYSKSGSSPEKGRWYYDRATHRAFVNPMGSSSPNDQARILVPSHRGLLEALARGCPDTECPPINHLTLRRLSLEGGRFVNLEMVSTPSAGDMENITLESVKSSWTTRFGWLGTRFRNLRVRGLEVEQLARGISTAEFEGAFGIRLFHVHEGSFEDVVIKHIGSAGGNEGARGCAAGGTPGVWLDPPWNLRPENPHCMGSVGFDLKQSHHVVVRKFRAADLSGIAFKFDDTRDSELADCSIERVMVAISHMEFTPDSAGKADTLKNNSIHHCRIDDAGWNDSGAVNLQTTNDTLGDQEFTVRVYNNVLTHVSRAGFMLRQEGGSGGDQLMGVQLWNNTVWNDRSSLGYPIQPDGGGGNHSATTPAAGILIDTDSAYPVRKVVNLRIQNNLFVGLPAGGVVTSGTGLQTTSVSIDTNFYAKDSVVPALRWKDQSFQELGPSSRACAQAGLECAGHIGNPGFQSPAGRNIEPRLSSSSDARDKGVELSTFFTDDFAKRRRPVGRPWDIGAYQAGGAGPPAAPSLLEIKAKKP